MIVYGLLWLSLALGVAGSLCWWEALCGTWLRMARVPAPVRRPVWQHERGTFKSSVEGDRFLPLPGGVVTRAGPAPWGPAG